MSRLKNKLAADDQQQNIDQDTQEQVDESIVQPTQEVQDQNQNQEEGTQAGVLSEYGEDYTNQWGKVTPYHVLFKDYGEEISTLTKDQAIDTCLRVIQELGDKFNGDPDYTNPSPEALAKFKNAISKGTRSGMDVLFKIKDFLLASEGLAVMSTLEDAFKNPKIAKKVAKVFDTLIAVHEASKKR